jgi:hypothetical protein
MPRIDLDVPFAEKDEAREAGAWWDGNRKVWYIPDGIDPFPLRKWFPIKRIIDFEALLALFINIVEYAYTKHSDEIEELQQKIAELEKKFTIN